MSVKDEQDPDRSDADDDPDDEANDGTDDDPDSPDSPSNPSPDVPPPNDSRPGPGDDDPSPDDDVPTPPNGTPGPGPAPSEPCVAELDEQVFTPLRRLTAVQFRNAVTELFGPGIDAGGSFPSSSTSHRFTSYMDANIVSTTGQEGIWQASLFVAGQVASAAAEYLPCPVDDALGPCLQEFSADLAERAYRRPPTPDELTTLNDLLLDAAPEDSVEDIVERIVATILLSPQFLYVDDGRMTTNNEEGGLVAIDSHGLGARLALFLWDGLPDDELRDHMNDGSLTEPGTLATQIERMLDDPRAAPVLTRFHSEWLGLNKMGGLRKDETLFPEFDAELIQSIQGETERFVEDIVFQQRGGIDELLTDTRGFSDARTDVLFGVSSGSTGAGDFQAIDLGSERGGLLRRPAFLAMQAYERHSAPVRRGVFVIRQLLCIDMTVPDDVSTEGVDGEPSEGNTVRDRLAAHRADPSCAGCHNLIDPIGFAFEHFDAVGSYRDEWLPGVPVDASGTLPNPPGNFDDAGELLALLLTAPELDRCYATQWYRFVMGREETAKEQCFIDGVADATSAQDDSVLSLVTRLASSDALLYRVAEAPEEL